MIIPREILDDYKSLKTAAEVTFTLRALTNTDNERGETYVVGDEQCIVIYSGKFGQKKERQCLLFTDILDFIITEEEPFVLLTLLIENQQMLMKFRMSDSKKLQSLKRFWERRQASDQPAAELPEAVKPIEQPTVHSTVTLRPRIAFSAALHAMVFIDNEAAEMELRLLQLLLMDQDVIDEGRACWRKVGTTELIVILSSFLSEDQKECLLINLIDMAMIDGRFRSSEREFLEYTRDLFEISEAKYTWMFDAMMLKNGLHVFEVTTICPTE